MDGVMQFRGMQILPDMRARSTIAVSQAEE